MKVSMKKSFVVFADFETSTKPFFDENYILVSLFKYAFKRMRDEVVLPDSCGELNRILAPSAIKEANNEVKDVLGRGSKRAPYLKATLEMKVCTSTPH